MTEVVVCQYTAKPGQEEALEALLREHEKTLVRLGLKTDTPTQLLKGLGDDPERHGAKGRYIEIFSWSSDDAMQRAHEAPEVMAIWEGIGAVCSAMDFPSYARI